jgi:hypothetical protein
MSFVDSSCRHYHYHCFLPQHPSFRHLWCCTWLPETHALQPHTGKFVVGGLRKLMSLSASSWLSPETDSLWYRSCSFIIKMVTFSCAKKLTCCDIGVVPLSIKRSPFPARRFSEVLVRIVHFLFIPPVCSGCSTFIYFVFVHNMFYFLSPIPINTGPRATLFDTRDKNMAWRMPKDSIIFPENWLTSVLLWLHSYICPSNFVLLVCDLLCFWWLSYFCWVWYEEDQHMSGEKDL